MKTTGITITTAGRATHPHCILPVFSGDGFAPAPLAVAENAKALAALRGFAGRQGQRLLLPQGGGADVQQWLFAGLGTPESLFRADFCGAIGAAFHELRDAGGQEISLVLPPTLPWDAETSARWAAEALGMAAYRFGVYRSEAAPPVARVQLVREGEQAALRRGLAAGTAVSAGIDLARDLINHPPAVAHTDFMLAQLRALARRTGSKTRQIRGAQLLAKGYQAIYAVGQAAVHPPALAVLEYGRKNWPTLALVGKGVVFDSGGLNLKTAVGMQLMKKDMGGAAIVLGAFEAIATLGLSVHLVAVLGLAENAVGPRAYRPGDVLRSKQGLSIEITNTDAEGRVVLADAFALAAEHAPDYMVDFATLTGACRIALGKELMGLFCDHAPLREGLLESARVTGEPLWPLPLWQPYRKQLDSAVADMANASTDGFGGAITAALFLQTFARNIAWAHLDCYAWSEGNDPLFPKGGSGAGVRLMVELASRIGAGQLG